MCLGKIKCYRTDRDCYILESTDEKSRTILPMKTTRVDIKGQNMNSQLFYQIYNQDACAQSTMGFIIQYYPTPDSSSLMKCLVVANSQQIVANTMEHSCMNTWDIQLLKTHHRCSIHTMQNRNI